MALSFEKAKEEVKLSFEKIGLTSTPRLRIGLCEDLSGSIRHLFSNGTLQYVSDCLLAAAAVCDDNGEMEVYGFSEDHGKLGDVTSKDFGNSYLTKMVQDAEFSVWNSTVYSNVLKQMFEDYYQSAGQTILSAAKSFFGMKSGEEKKDPVFIMFLTDGNCNPSDVSWAEVAMKFIAASNKSSPMFIQFVGIGNESFSLLKEFRDKFDNTDFINFSSIPSDSQALYDSLFSTKFKEWYNSL